MKNLITKSMAGLMVFLFFTCNSLFAQNKRNHIIIHSGAYYCFNNVSNTFGPFNTFSFTSMGGLKYQYDISESIGIYVNCSMVGGPWSDLFPMGGASFTENAGPLDERYLHYYPNGDLYSFYNPEGQLWSRGPYYFFDLGGSYTYSISKRHKVSGHVGLSYACGNNELLTKLVLSQQPPIGSGDVMFGTNIEEWKVYGGAVAGISYDYYFWKERLNAGVTVNLRYYGSEMPFFTDYGFHLGYNF